MYSKSLLTAIAAALLSSCSLHAPWSHEPVGEEVNVSFVMRKNLIVLPSMTINGRGGTFLLSVTQPRTILDARFAQAAGTSGSYALQLNDKEALRFTPVVADLRGVADAILGRDVWGSKAISIDYRSGLLTYQREGIHSGLMTLFRYRAEPTINIDIDGRTVAAIVDTTSPDTVTLPRGSTTPPHARGRVALRVAQTDFGTIDAGFGDVDAPRIGNRVLSKFLITVDYGRREVGLWRDPRTPL